MGRNKAFGKTNKTQRNVTSGKHKRQHKAKRKIETQGPGGKVAGNSQTPQATPCQVPAPGRRYIRASKLNFDFTREKLVDNSID